MAIDEKLAAHVRSALAGASPVRGSGCSAASNGRAIKGFIRVETALDARGVKSWLRLARSFVETLPARKAAAKPGRKRSET